MALRAIYYDTETTGVKPDKDRIIEIAAYDVEKNKEFVSLINPGTPIPKEATAVHNITDEMVAEAPTFKEVAEQFNEFCSGETVLIAHNNDAFDKPFLEKEYQRAGVSIPEWHFIDTLKWSRKYRPDLPRHSLQHLREIHGIPANNAHRALDDVVMLHKIFSIMIDDLPMDVVHKLLQQEGNADLMPFGKYKGRAVKDIPKSYVSWLFNNGALDKAENQKLKEAFEKHDLLPC